MEPEITNEDELAARIVNALTQIDVSYIDDLNIHSRISEILKRYAPSQHWKIRDIIFISARRKLTEEALTELENEIADPRTKEQVDDYQARRVFNVILEKVLPALPATGV